MRSTGARSCRTSPIGRAAPTSTEALRALRRAPLRISPSPAMSATAAPASTPRRRRSVEISETTAVRFAPAARRQRVPRRGSATAARHRVRAVPAAAGQWHPTLAILGNHDVRGGNGDAQYGGAGDVGSVWSADRRRGSDRRARLQRRRGSATDGLPRTDPGSTPTPRGGSSLSTIRRTRPATRALRLDVRRGVRSGVRAIRRSTRAVGSRSRLSAQPSHRRRHLRRQRRRIGNSTNR